MNETMKALVAICTALGKVLECSTDGVSWMPYDDNCACADNPDYQYRLVDA